MQASSTKETKEMIWNGQKIYLAGELARRGTPGCRNTASKLAG